MPGTIHVSVLEIIGVQSLTTSSQIRVKVSIGKREHQAWNKGDFSFPLTTLRDNVIVTLEDADGNEISHTKGIDMRLLIGKGIWDDIFPLDGLGGGHVHLKLQFFLSEDDRQRIRIMRESALKKKHDELLSSRSTSMAHKVESDHHSAQTNASPNGTEGCQDTSSNRVKEVKKQRSVVFSNDGTSIETISKQQKALEKAHGSVRNMISAFESSGHQDMRSKVIRQQITKSQSVNNLVNVNTSKSKMMQKVRSTDSLSGQLSSCLPQPDNIHMKEEETGNQDMESIVRPEMTKSQSGLSLRSKMQNVTGANETEKIKFLEDLDRRKSANERASFSGSIHDQQTSGDVITRKSDSTIGRREMYSSGDDQRSPECSGAWIFADQGRRLCVTTAGKQVLNIIGGFCCERERISGPGNMENRIEHFVDGDVAKESGEDGEKSVAEGSNSRDVETPRGPIGQVMRVAMMAGFAALIVFTRQRNQ